MKSEHAHHHEHDHMGSHAHAHLSSDIGFRFFLAIALNALFVAIEYGFGIYANSTALLADASHNLTDVLGLVLAWAAASLNNARPSTRYTYGFRSSTIWAALANSVLLLLACGGIGWEAIQRLQSPHPVGGPTVVAVAATGIAINGISAWLFYRSGKNDINIRGAFIHMLSDALVSLGVVVAGVVITYTGWNWLDACISLAIVAIIALSSWGVLREAVQLSLYAVPEQVSLKDVRDFLGEQHGVAAVQDLHIWGVGTSDIALTARLVMPSGSTGDAFLQELAHELKDKFSIAHSTIQIMSASDSDTCAFSH